MITLEFSGIMSVQGFFLKIQGSEKVRFWEFYLGSLVRINNFVLADCDNKLLHRVSVPLSVQPKPKYGFR